MNQIFVSIFPIVVRKGTNIFTGATREVIEYESKAFDKDMNPIMTSTPQGEPYQVGQISTSLSWAQHDIKEHFRDLYDSLFPDGWYITFI